MGLFQKFKEGLFKTRDKLAHEIKRIVTASPKLTSGSLEELEAALIAADLGTAMTAQIMAAVKKAYETQGRAGLDVFAIARAEVEKSLAAAQSDLRKQTEGLTIVSIVGVNGTGKTTTAAKLANLVQARGHTALLAACDTFRAAAVEQLKLWGERLHVPVVAGAHGADAASVAHDSITAALARKADYLFIDTAGRLHTKHNLMQELEKVHRVMAKKLPGAPHETLLVLDASTGMNALVQARAFHKSVPLTGLVITKLDGTSRGGSLIGVYDRLRVPIKLVGVGEKATDLLDFKPERFAGTLFD